MPYDVEATMRAFEEANERLGTSGRAAGLGQPL
jgi:hypothetical protein